MLQDFTEMRRWSSTLLALQIRPCFSAFIFSGWARTVWVVREHATHCL